LQNSLHPVSSSATAHRRVGAVRGIPGVTGPEPDGTHIRILSVVRRIPPGRVLTYGDVAALAELPRHARLVGYALHALPAHTAVPWHRVVNHRGGISTGRAWPGGELAQRHRLEAEGVAFDANGRLSLERYRWTPPIPLPEPIDPCE
jgi:methylated-DNA-protein-cysteine methyltransferase related protein